MIVHVTHHLYAGLSAKPGGVALGVGDLPARAAAMTSPLMRNFSAHPIILDVPERRFFGKVDHTRLQAFVVHPKVFNIDVGSGADIMWRGRKSSVCVSCGAACWNWALTCVLH
jgi:hypothetical protein